MRRVVVLASGNGWHIQDLMRAGQALEIDVQVTPFPKLTGLLGDGPPKLVAGPIDLTHADGVLVRMMPPGTLEQVVFRMDALHRLQALGVPVLNPPAAIEAAVDKYLALARLDAAGLPVPQTWVGESASEALRAFEQLGGDVVIKPLFGAEGRGLLRVKELELARRALHTLERLGAVLYLQQFIAHPGYDYRLFVLGDRVLGAIRRMGSGDDWRTNVACGAVAESCALDPAAQELAVCAARAVGARVAGVDLLPDPSGRLLITEVNAVPGWKALSAATGIDVAAAVLQVLLGSC